MSARFDLDCNDCSFELTITGTQQEVLDAIERHKASVAEDANFHVVDVTRTEDSLRAPP